MTIPTVALNENTPAGGDFRREGDDRIREYKTQNREVLEVDHEYPSSGQDADAGKHKQVTLIEQADIGTGATGYAAFGAQTCDGKPEAVFTDEDDTDVQITKAGHINGDEVQSLSSQLQAAIINALYPVGSIYISTLSTNPGTLLGTGTWATFGAGKTLVSLDSGDSDFDTAEETGGAKTHTLTEAELPAHKHTVPFGTASAGTDLPQEGASNDSVQTTRDSSTVGSGSAHNNLQPYIVVYMWKRTA